jgi:hypothetical protein
MRAIRRVIGWTGLALLAIVALMSCGGTGGPAVATVSGEQIGSQPLANWTRIELVAGQARDRADARRVALDLLIRWQWILDEARMIHVSVTAREVEKQLEQTQFEQSNGITFEWFPGEATLRPLLAHVSRSDRLTLLKLGMLEPRILRQRIVLLERTLPHAAIMGYYRRHRGRFQTGERRDIRSIVNYSRAKTLEAKREMQQGVPFRIVAKRFNQSFEGGLLIDKPRGRQEKRLEKDYFSARPHVIVGPLLEILFYVFEVSEIRPSTLRRLSEVEGTIRRQLATERARAVLEAEERHWRERTICLSGYVAHRCGGYRGKLS